MPVNNLAATKMRYIIEFSGEKPDFFLAECRSLIRTEPIFQFGRIYSINTDRRNEKYLARFAYAKRIFRVMDEVSDPLLIPNLKIPCFKGSYKFDVDFIKDDKLRNRIMLAAKLIRNKVDLKSPKNRIVFFMSGSILSIAEEIDLFRHDFENRKNHNLIYSRPISLHPRLARFCVNLTGCRDGRIVDPMCGLGGLLIEALLMGLDIKGFDIKSDMVNEANQNISMFSRSDAKQISQKDLFDHKQKFRYIVTDPPYGRNTSLSSDFYDLAFRKLREISSNKVVVIIPDSQDIDPKRYGFKIIEKLDYFIHKSMTKNIYLLE